MTAEMSEAMQVAICKAAERQDSWVDEQIKRHAPALADVPERTARFLSNVHRMMVADNPREAEQYAAEVAREAPTLAVMRCEWSRLRIYYLARAPMELRVDAATLAKVSL